MLSLMGQLMQCAIYSVTDLPGQQSGVTTSGIEFDNEAYDTSERDRQQRRPPPPPFACMTSSLMDQPLLRRRGLIHETSMTGGNRCKSCIPYYTLDNFNYLLLQTLMIDKSRTRCFLYVIFVSAMLVYEHNYNDYTWLINC